MRALWAPPTRRRLFASLAGWLVWASLGFCAPSALADEPTLRLRIAWGGGVERTWHGTIGLSSGSLKNPQPLGLETDEAGSIWLTDTGSVEIRSPSPRGYDGIDVEIQADLSAKLLIALSADGETAPQQAAIELSQLIKEPQFKQLDDKKNRLLVRRAPGDALRVQLDAPSLVFGPDEKLPLRVQPHLLGVETPAALWLRTQMIASHDKRELLSREQEAALPAEAERDPTISLDLRTPTEPGVYDLVLSISKTRQSERLLPGAPGRELISGAVGNLPGLGRLQRSDAIAERRVQFMVVGDAPTPAAKRPGPPSTELMTIQPGQTWWDRVAHIPRIAGLGKEPLEYGSVERWEHPKLGPLMLLQARKAAAGLPNPLLGKPPAILGAAASADLPPDETWVAYPLSVSQPGQVHTVEVEYPSDIPQAMAISVVEPNAAGAVVPIGLDSGICVSTETAAEPPRLATHRLAFWPRTRAPLLLISRADNAPRAVHGRIRLLGPRRYGVGAIRVGPDAHSALAPATEGGDASERLVMGMLERPLFPENFGAAETLDAWSGGSLDDWTTFYDGGRRMLEYAQHVGYNALAVSVLADGSSIYPSARLAPTPRYDTGAFFSTGQDPVRKDVLELLLRLADREQMTLIPLVQFSAPLPELEIALHRGGADAAGIKLVGANGITWLEKYGTRRGQTAYYNPLDPRVQEAMRGIVRELAERYGQHRSFGGVVLGSSGPSYTLLPGIEWGLDDATFKRFCDEQGVAFSAAGPGRFAERAKLVAGPQRQAWLRWRADAMHRFHAQLRDDLVAARPGARLIVATGGMLQGPDAEAALRPTLPPRLKIDDLPLAAGIRPDLYRHDDAIVLLRPRLVSAPSTPRTLAVDLPAADAPELDGSFAEAAAFGDLFVHTPLRSRLTTFDSRSPFGADKTFLSQVTHLACSAPQCRRRFVQTLAALDAPLLVDGGWMLTLGEEEALRPLLLTFRRLPLGEYQPVAGESQGITCRWLQRDGTTYLYLLNPTAWPCRANLAVRGDLSAAVTELSGLREPVRIVGGQLSLALEPYDLLALRIGTGSAARGAKETPSASAAEARGTDAIVRKAALAGDQRAAGVTFSNLNVTFEPRVREALDLRIRALVTRAALSAEPRRIDVLANPDFERPAEGARDLPGWTLSGAATSRVALDSDVKFAGRSAARLSSSSGVASLISDPFKPPQTGRVSVAVRLRGLPAHGAPGNALTLRLALGGKLEGGEYYRFAEAPLSGQWKYFIFTVDNLPLSGLSDLQVRFDLMGQGQAWIDDVGVCDLALSDNERTDLSRIVTRAQFSLEDGRLADCVRLLDSYWPRFLEENVPLPPGGVTARRAAPAPSPQDAAPQDLPAEATVPWWKRGLPSVFR